MKLHKNFVGGNIRIIKTDGDTVFLDNELRDTTEDWFYFAFCVEGAATREKGAHRSITTATTRRAFPRFIPKREQYAKLRTKEYFTASIFIRRGTSEEKTTRLSS